MATLCRKSCSRPGRRRRRSCSPHGRQRTSCLRRKTFWRRNASLRGTQRSTSCSISACRRRCQGGSKARQDAGKKQAGREGGRGRERDRGVATIATDRTTSILIRPPTHLFVRSYRVLMRQRAAHVARRAVVGTDAVASGAVRVAFRACRQFLERRRGRARVSRAVPDGMDMYERAHRSAGWPVHPSVSRVSGSVGQWVGGLR